MKTGRATRRREPDHRGLAAGACAVAGILLLSSSVLWLTTPAAGPRDGVGGPFTLVADDGQRVTERSFPGKYLAPYFGYTARRDICPATMTNLAAALGRLGSAGERVQPLFITVDPLRDTPAVLRRYVANFSPRLRGLTGSLEELGKVDREYHVVSVTHREHAAVTGYAVDHSSVIYLLGPDGAFPGADPGGRVRDDHRQDDLPLRRRGVVTAVSFPPFPDAGIGDGYRLLPEGFALRFSITLRAALAVL